MKDDNILLGQIEDKMIQCENSYMATHTGFLSLHQRSLSLKIKAFPSVTRHFDGGYEDAERVVLSFLPDYMKPGDESPLALLRVTKKPGSRELTHRDYLGSIIGLGIDRSVIGDILVNEEGADIICLKEISEFLELEYAKAGRTNLEAKLLPITDLRVAPAIYKEETDTVASLRLDNIISSAFGISRVKAAAAISKGIVFVNNMEMSKVDSKVKAGDKLVLRGKGKVNVAEIGGRSRKDRIYVTYHIY